MKFKLKICFILLIFSTLQVYGQGETEQPAKKHKRKKLFVNLQNRVDTIFNINTDSIIQGGKPDEIYIRKVKSDFKFGVALLSFDNFITVYDNSGEAASIASFYPNNTFNIGLKAKYKFIDLSYAISLPQIAGREETKSTNLKLNYTSNFYNFGISAYYLRNKGLMTSSPLGGLIDINGLDEEYNFREDIRTTSIGAGLSTTFTNKVSLPAAYNSGFIQTKSGGGWGAGGDIDYTKLEGDSSLIDPEKDHLFGYLYDQRRIQFLTISLYPSYTYTYVFPNEKFYATGQLGLGVGASLLGSFDVEDNRDFQLRASINQRGLVVVGYRTNNFTLHAYGRLTAYQLNLKEQSISSINRLHLGLSSAYRF